MTRRAQQNTYHDIFLGDQRWEKGGRSLRVANSFAPSTVPASESAFLMMRTVLHCCPDRRLSLNDCAAPSPICHSYLGMQPHAGMRVDKYRLYQQSVQSPEGDLSYMLNFHRHYVGGKVSAGHSLPH